VIYLALVVPLKEIHTLSLKDLKDTGVTMKKK